MTKKSKNNNFLIVLCIILIIGIILLLIEGQRKDNKIVYLNYKINELKNGETNVSKSDMIGKIKKTIEENLDKIIDKKPPNGYKWFLDEVKFIKNDIVKIQYEDGHTLNSITVKITNPDDYKTWVKVDNLKR